MAQAQPFGGLTALDAAGERQVEVSPVSANLMVQRHPLRPGRLTADIRDRGDLLGDAEHAVAVRCAQRTELASSGRVLGSESPDCVEQAVPGVSVQLAMHAV